MAFDTVVRHDTDGSITLLDGTGTPVTIVVPFTQGDLTIDGLSKDLREVVAYQSRGTLHSIRYGDKTFPTVTFTAMTNVSCTFSIGEGRPNVLTVNGTVYGSITFA
jgi:hypothetical protein